MAFKNVFTHGNLVDINVRFWMGRIHWSPEDIGISDKHISGVFDLGKKKLIPAAVVAKFRSLDYKIRTALEKYSFPFDFGAAKFVPKKIFLKFAEEADQTINEFNKQVEAFVRNYPRYKLIMRKDYVKAAHEAYKIAQSVDRLDMDEDRYVEKYLQRIDKLYPSAEEVRKKYSMEYIVYRMELPDISKATYEDVSEENDKLRLFEAAYRRDLERKTYNFVDTVITTLRQKLARSFNSAAKQVRDGKYVSIPTMNRIRKSIRNFEDMDIVGDDRFRKILKDFEDRALSISHNTINANKKIRDNFYNDLKGVADLAVQRSTIDEVAAEYRKKIDL